MSSAIPISKKVGWLNPDKTVNFKALSAHIASVEDKIFPDTDVSRNAPKPPALPPSGGAGRVAGGGVSYGGGIGSKIFTGIKHKGFFKPIVHLPDSVESADGGKNEVHIGSVDISSDDNRYYWFGTVEVGTPPQRFTVELDTGSGDLFLPSASCGDSCAGHTLWDPSTSSTVDPLDKRTFSLKFRGGGIVNGSIVADTVSIAGYTATAQTLGAALSYSTHLGSKTFPPDGLLGLAFEEKSTFEARPLIQTLHAQGQIAEPVFSLKFASPGGELYIGGTRRDRYTGEFTYTPVLSIRSWQVMLEKIEVDGKTILSDIKCIIDTGTALILGMNDQVASLYKAIGGRFNREEEDYHYYSFPGDSFPTISFTFGGTAFPIRPSALKLGLAEAGSSEYISGIAGHNCIHALGQTNWLIGAVFLQSVYTTFDLGVKDVRKPRIGFATLADA